MSTDDDSTETGTGDGTEETSTDDGSPFARVADADELRESGRLLVNRDGRAIALFHHEGEVRAVDNRCPHMGFPLTEGTVDDGVLTCHWHHARFELACGDTFDPWADDLPTYPVELRDGGVWVDPEPRRGATPADHWRERLDVGLEENLRLVLAKAAIGLADAGVERAEPFRRGLAFGVDYRAEGWSSGLTIHTALANVGDHLSPADRRRATYVGLSEVAADCAGSAPRFEQPALSNRDVGADRLKAWFRSNVEVRDADGAERTLRAAVDACTESEVAEILLAAATDHRYLDTGHALDFVNKAFEALDQVGHDARTADVLATTVDGLADADRAEERSEWRQPIDVAALVEEACEELPALVEERPGPDTVTGSDAGADAESVAEWSPPDGFQETLLGDDPSAIVDGITDQIPAGATPADLAREVVAAAARRIAQFSTVNEFGDWNTVHHTYTYANAVHGMTRRTDCIEGYRGVLDAAINVYLDRFLNVPPADVPDGDPDADPDASLDALLATFEREGAVDEASARAADFLAGGGDPGRLTEAVGGALLREDAGFHVIQNVEVGFRQAELSDDDRRRALFLVAAARYLGAHTPTRREREQTFTIAERLNRGERVHESTTAD